MINLEDKLTILHDDNGSFTDYTDDLNDFMRDTASFTYTTSEDYIMIGFDKPINGVYIDFSTPNGSSASLTLEYFKTDTWTAITNRNDNTKGFTRSGHIRWERNLTNEAKTTVNSVEKYWYRLSLDVTSALVVKGINIVFSDDMEMKKFFNAVDSTDVLGSNTSHIAYHVAARDYIMQKLRNQGNKVRNLEGDYDKLSHWDLLDIEEVKMGATFKALSLLFDDLSDADDDWFMRKSLQYDKEYMKMMNGVDLSVDTDDDGVKDDNENLSTKGSVIYFSR